MSEKVIKISCTRVWAMKSKEINYVALNESIEGNGVQCEMRYPAA
jgi:hypothetical protein